MKKTLFYIAAALYGLAHVQAAENADNQVTKNPGFIPCRVINTSQTSKRLLGVIVVYHSGKEEEFSAILDKIKKETPRTEKIINFFSGEVSQIALSVFNYHGEGYKYQPNYCEETLIASSSFSSEPSSLLKEITFTIRRSKTSLIPKIDVQPVYG